jgi:UDP-N-acetylglucosamine acyltransferase
MNIHNTSIIDPAARVGKDVQVGPYAVIGKNVVLEDGCKIHSHAVIDGNTTIGPGTEIFPHASIGLRCQDLKFKGETTYVKIGANTIIRECATVNASTGENGTTIVGERCLLMAYTHVAHNCELGNDVIMSNCASLAGHITVSDKAIISGLAAIHQFCRVGTMSMIGGLSKVIQDVPPYALSDGWPCAVMDINAIGLKRAGVSEEDRRLLRRAFKILFKSGLNMKNAVKQVKDEFPETEYITHLLEFIQTTKRGIGR